MKAFQSFWLTKRRKTTTPINAATKVPTTSETTQFQLSIGFDPALFCAAKFVHRPIPRSSWPKEQPRKPNSTWLILIERSASRSQIKHRYGSHHQQPKNDSRNDVLDPFLIVREPFMHAIHGQHSYRPDPTEHVITSRGRCT